MRNESGPALAVSPRASATLRRELGKWDLTAIGINQVLGSAVFILPSQIAARVGGWSPVAFLAVGLTSLLIALCFAEVGSRFERTGGPYLYARAAFGPFVAFEVGWMQWFTRVTSQAAVVNAITLALAFYWAGATSGIGRGSLIAAITLALGWINIRGVRLGAFLVNLLTISKLLPLGILSSLASGMSTRTDSHRSGPSPCPRPRQRHSCSSRPSVAMKLSVCQRERRPTLGAMCRLL